MKKPSRLELTVFAQAWRDTLAQFPGIVIAEQIRIASQILWLELDEDGDTVTQVTDLKMTPSQATSIKGGKTDAQGRSLEGLVLALYQYSQETGQDAFGFYLERLSVLLNQRGQDLLNRSITPGRRKAFLEATKGRKPAAAIPEHPLTRSSISKIKDRVDDLLPPASSGIRDLLEKELLARGLRPDEPEDRERFVSACQGLGMNISLDDVNSVFDGQHIDDILLGRLRNVIIQNRMTGQLWSFEELEQIRDHKPLEGVTTPPSKTRRAS